MGERIEQVATELVRFAGALRAVGRGSLGSRCAGHPWRTAPVLSPPPMRRPRRVAVSSTPSLTPLASVRRSRPWSSDS